ncbi:MAG: hypothetical protein HY820_39565 [Acidobacteria bacterium]|nr:hypothetical protein [Acidobacteriota bacterium]
MNGGPGSVTITFPGELKYTPGVKQRLVVQVADPGMRLFGFQATARRETNLTRDQAGSFSSVDSSTQILCDGAGQIRPNAGCPANASVEFIEHTRAVASGTFTIEWTPPATDVGNVRIYVAGNATNGNGQNTGDRVYTANYVLTPGATTPPPPAKPSISSDGIKDLFGGTTGVVAGAWFTLAGADLASATNTWDSLVAEGALPTAIDGVSVKINDKLSTLASVSATTIRALAANDIGSGPVNVVVTNANGESTPFSVTATDAVKPSLYAPVTADGKSYVSAMAKDGTVIGNPSATRAAAPGETIILFANGLGVTNPVSDTNKVVKGAPAITVPVKIRFNEDVATLTGTGNLVYAGIYQLVLTVPSTLADGEYQLIVEQNSVASSNGVYITVKAQ